MLEMILPRSFQNSLKILKCFYNKGLRTVVIGIFQGRVSKLNRRARVNKQVC